MKSILLAFVLIQSLDADINDSLTRIIENINSIHGALRSNKDVIQISARMVEQMSDEMRSDTMSTTIKKLTHIPMKQMIEDEGYPVESHYVTTSDGYILNIFRIPYGKYGKKRNKIVFLQHGLLSSASDWILFGEQQSLAYILADDGYDVWLGNCRGNRYSRNHTKWNPDNSREFWQFSWHEIGVIDTPETIDYILNETGEKNLYHIGHSQGSTTFYVMTSIKPQYNAKIKHHISLAPVAFMNHMFSPLLRIVARSFRTIANALGGNEFFRTSGILNSFTEAICSETGGQVLCKNALFALVGFSPKQLNISNVSLIMSHFPSGASIRQVEHFAQEIISGRFCQYDFGKLKNKAIYGRPDPPDYNLSKISASVSLIYSSNDWLAAVVDVDRLSKQLKNVKEKYLIPIPTWNHLDFVFGNEAPSVVYHKILKILARS